MNINNYSLSIVSNNNSSLIINRSEKKVIIFGYGDVGKTSLIQRYIFNHFSEDVKNSVMQEMRRVVK